MASDSLSLGRTDGRSVIRNWLKDAGPRWTDSDSGEGAYRLLFDDQNVLYCRDQRSFVSVFVDVALPGDVHSLLAFGPSLNGYDSKRAGIRLRVPESNLPALLEWCRQRLESGSTPRAEPEVARVSDPLMPRTADAHQENATYGSIADEIYACACQECPAYQRIELGGYFPKFGAGGRSEVVLAIVTMNPGPLSTRRAADRVQLSHTRRTLSRAGMHQMYEAGLLDYHRNQRRGGLVDLPAIVAETCGLRWDQVYYTEVAKCVTIKGEPREEVLITCSSRYLLRELGAFADTLSYIVCLGSDAQAHTTEICEAHPALSRLAREGRICPVHHPSWHSRFGTDGFSNELRTALTRARSLIAETS